MCRIFPFLFIALVVTACRNEEDAGRRTLPPPDPVPDTRESRLLLRNYWVFELFVVPRNRELSLASKGKWYKFSADGTFEAGYWQDYTTRGNWSLRYGGEFPLIHLNAENEALTGEYEIQGFSNDTEYSSWVGTARYGQKGHAAKVMNLLSIPTRRQFGVEE